ncbi:hypothetical protein R6Q59_015532 [Mikania micrantha]
MPPCDLDDVSGSQTPVRREVYDDGRIIEISHRYHPDMPSWLSDDGLGQFPPASGEQLMWQKQFDTSYVGFLKDGAQWLKDKTDIKLVGKTHPLSLTHTHTHKHTHTHYHISGGEIILVEDLKLDNVEAGIYNVHCLPLRLLGAEGSPIRCILIK